MKRTDSQYLNHIIRYCELILKSMDRYGREYAIFQDDMDYHDSVSMKLLQIGELAKGLSDAFIQSHSEVPWKAIKGMRAHFAHGYASMDLKEIWNTACYDIPALRDRCNEYIAQMEAQEIKDITQDDMLL